MSISKPEPIVALSWAGVLLAISLVIVSAYAIYRVAQADGKVTYCYAEYWSPSEMPPMIRLFGYRPWREDRKIGNYKDLAEATEAAQMVGCKIESQQ